MNIAEQITKKTDEKALKALLGVDMYTNIKNLYNRLKKAEIHTLFYKDYLSEEKPNKWFVKDLLTYEDHIDFTKPINDSDYNELLAGINEGYGQGDVLTHHVAKHTDAYIGDGILKYTRK